MVLLLKFLSQNQTYLQLWNFEKDDIRERLFTWFFPENGVHVHAGEEGGGGGQVVQSHSRHHKGPAHGEGVT